MVLQVRGDSHRLDRDASFRRTGEATHGGQLAAIPDGGQLATVRGFAGPSERGITIEPVRVASYVLNHEALDRLGQLVAKGRLTLRVAETFPPKRAADAQQKMSAGGTRGRLVIVF